MIQRGSRLGVSAWNGVRGSLVDAAGNGFAHGPLGFWSLKDRKAFALMGLGTIATTGKKDFIEPHPTDPAQAIYYVCTESNESMVEVRGKGQTSGGTAVIPLSPSFSMVASPQSRSPHRSSHFDRRADADVGDADDPELPRAPVCRGRAVSWHVSIDPSCL